MDSEREIIISFLFKRSGKEHLKFSDLYLALSMDLNWFTPDDAKAFINSAIKENLLIKRDTLIKPNFDYEKTNVPVGFTPSKKVFEITKDNIEEKPVSILDELKKLIEKNKNIATDQMNELINKMAKEKNITEEVAAILIGREYNINFDDFYDKIEDLIFIDN
ncbi:MAG: DUF2240 family protein [Thermoplasmatales archaeon]|nr:MAG: DUF2240 family protein [Thermoplasmatales archaeon]